MNLVYQCNTNGLLGAFLGHHTTLMVENCIFFAKNKLQHKSKWYPTLFDFNNIVISHHSNNPLMLDRHTKNKRHTLINDSKCHEEWLESHHCDECVGDLYSHSCRLSSPVCWQRAETIKPRSSINICFNLVRLRAVKWETFFKDFRFHGSLHHDRRWSQIWARPWAVCGTLSPVAWAQGRWEALGAEGVDLRPDGNLVRHLRACGRVRGCVWMLGMQGVRLL